MTTCEQELREAVEQACAGDWLSLTDYSARAVRAVLAKLSEDDPERVERAQRAAGEHGGYACISDRQMRAALDAAGPSVVIVDAEALVHVQRAQVNALELELERAEARLADAVANTAELDMLGRCHEERQS